MQHNYYQAPQARGWDQAGARDDSREKFIVRTYNHLFLAIAAFTAIEVGLFYTGIAERIAKALMGTSWLLVLGGFILTSWLASSWAHRAETLGKQYAGLALYVVVEAIIFVPLLYIANAYAPGAIRSAAIVTLAGFAGLTALAFITRKDFSFLGSLIRWAGIVALIAIGASLIFGFHLGTWFSVAMVGLAGAAILYTTSNVLQRFPRDRYVAAALELFSSVALMFWYVLRIFMSRD